MFRKALTFAAATCTAALVGHTSALSYGRDVVHQPVGLAESAWQKDILPADLLLRSHSLLAPIEKSKKTRSDGPAYVILADASANVTIAPTVDDAEADLLNEMEGGEDLGLSLAPSDADADQPKSKKKKDRNRVNDPIEGVNRKVLGANDWLDRRVFRPLAKAYGFITPDFLERGIRNIFRNLREPATVGNRVLQGEFKSAGKSTARFLLNTTVGVAGFVDFADQIGLEREVADFGQTLYTYGVSAGPYLVVPLMGPTTTRDGFGQLVDRVADPATWVSLGASTTIAVNSLDGVSLREEVGDNLDQLRSTSIDWYSTLRSAYYQDRRAFLEGADANQNENVEDLFDEFDEFDAEETGAPLN